MANGVPRPEVDLPRIIAYMKKQLQSLGFAIDWERELATCSPGYYRWNQWLFCACSSAASSTENRRRQLGPMDQTVLANEQVIDGRGWRTGAPVENARSRCTTCGSRLTPRAARRAGNALRMARRVKTMQANWIGKSHGVNIGFPIRSGGEKKLLRVFTTRADTLMGATFCAVAANMRSAAHAARSEPKPRRFRGGMQARPCDGGRARAARQERHADGLFVTHPITGEKIEVWIGNYVLMAYGEGAVMACRHDERDFAFARNTACRQAVSTSKATLLRPGAGSALVRRLRPLREVRQARRPRLSERVVAIAATESEGPRRQAGHLAASRLGLARASATGDADSEIVHCASAATCRCRTASFRWCAGDSFPTAPAIRSRKTPSFVNRSVSEMRKPGKKREREHGHLRRFVLVLHPPRLSPNQNKSMVDERVKY